MILPPGDTEQMFGGCLWLSQLRVLLAMRGWESGKLLTIPHSAQGAPPERDLLRMSAVPRGRDAGLYKYDGAAPCLSIAPYHPQHQVRSLGPDSPPHLITHYPLLPPPATPCLFCTQRNPTLDTAWRDPEDTGLSERSQTQKDTSRQTALPGGPRRQRGDGGSQGWGRG